MYVVQGVRRSISLPCFTGRSPFIRGHADGTQRHLLLAKLIIGTQKQARVAALARIRTEPLGNRSWLATRCIKIFSTHIVQHKAL